MICEAQAIKFLEGLDETTEVVCMRLIPPLMILLMMLITPFLGIVPAPELNEQNYAFLAESENDEIALLTITYPSENTIFRNNELVELTVLIANLGLSTVSDLEIEVGLWKSNVEEGINFEDSWELEEFWEHSAICEDCYTTELESGEILGGTDYDIPEVSWFAQTGDYRFIVDIFSSTDTNISNNKITTDFSVYPSFDVYTDIKWNHDDGDSLDLDDNSISTTCPADGICYDFTVEVVWGLLDFSEDVDFELRDIVVEVNVSNNGVLDVFMINSSGVNNTHFYDDSEGQKESSYFISDVGSPKRVVTGYVPGTVVDDLDGDGTPEITETYVPLGENRYVAQMYYPHEFEGTIQVDGSNDAFQIEARVVSFKIWQNQTIPVECVENNLQMDIDPSTGEANGTIPEWLPCEIELFKDSDPETDMAKLMASDSTFDDIILTPITLESRISRSETPTHISQGANNILFGILYNGDDVVDDNYEFAIDVSINSSYGKLVEFTDVNSLNSPEDSPLGHRCSVQREDHNFVGAGVYEETLCFTYYFPVEGEYDISATIRIVNGYVDEISSNDVQKYHVTVSNQAPFVIMDLDAIEPLTLQDTFLIKLSGIDYDSPSDDSKNYRYELSLVSEDGSLTSLACTDEVQNGATKFCEGRITTQWLRSTHLRGMVTDMFGATSYVELPITVWAREVFENPSKKILYEVSYRSESRLSLDLSNDVNGDGSVNSQDEQKGVVLGNLPGTYDSVTQWKLSQISEMPETLGLQKLDVTFQLPDQSIQDDSNGTLWYFDEELSIWENIPTDVTAFDGFSKEQTITWYQDGGNLLSNGLYAVFVAKQGNPPSVGVAYESVVNTAGGIVQVDWELDGTLKSDEWLAIYYSSGSNAFDNSNGDADSKIITNRFVDSWQFTTGVHQTNYKFTIRTENAYGANLDGSKSNITMVDNAVDPEPIISNVVLTPQSSNILVTWESTNTMDVHHWKVCRGVDPNSLGTCEESTGTSEQMVTTKPTIKVKWFYAVVAVDMYGNEAQLGQATIDLSSSGGTIDDGGGDDTIGTQVEGSLPSWTFPAIGGVVVLSVIIGVLLVVRGGGSDDMDQDWDY